MSSLERPQAHGTGMDPGELRRITVDADPSAFPCIQGYVDSNQKLWWDTHFFTANCKLLLERGGKHVIGSSGFDTLSMYLSTACKTISSMGADAPLPA